MRRSRELQYFVIGFLIGVTIVYVPMAFFNRNKLNQSRSAHKRMDGLNKLHQATNQELFDETLSKDLFDTVKVLCMVMTHPENHRAKADHVRNVWGKRCNKLVFMSSKNDSKLGTVVLPLQESRANLWNKTKASFQYLYDNYIDEYDWFLKADDDNYIIVENLRYMLAHYNPNTALYIGHRYTAPQLEEGYMAGGGYILSKKALKKFAEKLVYDPKQCFTNNGPEDLEMGRCLAHYAIFVDSRDELHQKRFFPIGVEEHMKAKADPSYWYTIMQYYHVVQGNISCCSDTSTEYHYINTHQMYALDYFIYKVHPFGIDDHTSEALPQLLSLEEIAAASDANVTSTNFKFHQNDHQLDYDELY